MLINSKTILFLVGTALTSGHVLSNRTPGESWNPVSNVFFKSPKLSYLPSPPIEPTDIIAGSSPLLSDIWSQKTNLFYKPHIMITPGDMPILQKNCDESKQSFIYSGNKTFISKPLETTEFKPTPERPEEPLVQIMMEESPQPSPIMEIIEHKRPLVIPQAPELPSLHMSGIPAFTPIEVAPSFQPEELQIPHFSELKPIEIPKAPVLPLFVMPEIPTFVEKVPCETPEETKPLPKLKPIEITASTETPLSIVSKPMNIPKAPELPPLVFPELPAPVQVEFIPSHSPAAPSQPEEKEIVSEIKPLNIPFAPDFPLLYVPKPSFISTFLPMEPTESKESEINLEFKPYQIPVAPKLPPLYPQVIPSYSPKQLYPSAELIPEFRPVNLPAPPEWPSIALPELPTPIQITSNIIEHSPASEFSPLRVNIPAAPELPPTTLQSPALIERYFDSGKVKSTTTSEFFIPSAPELPPLALPELLTPDHGGDASAQELPLRENILAPPELPPLIKHELTAPIEIIKEAPAPEPKPQYISAAPQLPPLEIKSIFIEPHVLDSNQEDIKPLVVPQAPELPPLIISESHLTEAETLPYEAPVIAKAIEKTAAPLPEEKTVQVPVENHPFPKPPQLPFFVAHAMEPIVVEGPATVNNEEPCKKDEAILPAFISQSLQRPLMNPVFLAQNIIIERVVPNLYLSHNPNTDRLDSASYSYSHPVLRVL